LAHEVKEERLNKKGMQGKDSGGKTLKVGNKASNLQEASSRAQPFFRRSEGSRVDWTRIEPLLMGTLA
jgi:hypothetical protein